MTIELLPGISGVQFIPIENVMNLWDAGFPGSEVLRDHRALNRTHVRRLAESQGHWPPIELVHFIDNEQATNNYQSLEAYAIVDGRHRYEASKKLKYNVVAANIKTYKSVDSVIHIAILSNSQHGIASSPGLRVAHALWMYHQDGDRAPLDTIASIAGITTRSLKTAIDKENDRHEEKVEEPPLISPLDKFALDFYRTLSRLREQSEQEGLFYGDDGEDAGHVSHMVRQVLDELPPKNRRFMNEFIKVASGILDDVLK